MNTIHPLESQTLPADCFVFKHSTQCPISAAAADEVKAHSWSRPLYWINVIEQRLLSNWIEEEFHVRHESPQLLSIKAGKVVAVLNHRAIDQPGFAALESA